MVQGHVLKRNGRRPDLVVLQSVFKETTDFRSGSAYAMQPLNNKVEYFLKWILLIVLVFCHYDDRSVESHSYCIIPQT